MEIEVKEFEGYREIENQSHTVTPVSDGSIFSIKYEAIREDDREEELPVPGEDPGMNPDSEEEDTDKEEKYSYSFIFADGSGRQIGSKTGFAKRGDILEVPDIVLEGYETADTAQDAFTVEKDGEVFAIPCKETGWTGDATDRLGVGPCVGRERDRAGAGPGGIHTGG